MRRFAMEDYSDMAIIDELKQNLNDTIIHTNFDLLHPYVLHLSCKIDTLLVPIFRKQLPKAKVINFPIKSQKN